MSMKFPEAELGRADTPTERIWRAIISLEVTLHGSAADLSDEYRAELAHFQPQMVVEGISGDPIHSGAESVWAAYETPDTTLEDRFYYVYVPRSRVWMPHASREEWRQSGENSFRQYALAGNHVRYGIDSEVSGEPETVRMMKFLTIVKSVMHKAVALPPDWTWGFDSGIQEEVD